MDAVNNKLMRILASVLTVRRRSMKLSNYSQGRDNNFNLIRIVAAFAVLVTHSFALAIGTGDAEPFRGALGMTIGINSSRCVFYNQRLSCYIQPTEPTKYY